MKISVFDGIETVANAVFHATWQASLLALVAIAILFCLGQRILASWRFALWLVVFARFAALWVPTASWSLYSVLPTWGENQSEVKIASPTRRVGPIMFHDEPTTAGAAEVLQSSRFNRPASIASVDAPPDRGRNLATGDSAPAKPLYSIAQWLTLVWCIGAIALLVRLFVQHRRLDRRCASWIPINGSKIASAFEQFQVEANIRKPVTVVLSEDQTGPATCGVLRPFIVLPATLAEKLTLEELRLIVLHELIHVRRFDALTDLFASVVAAVHWFNPFAWAALAGLRHERELACDAATLELVGYDSRKEYGAILLRAAESLQLAVPAGTVAMFERRLFAGSLENRIQSVMAFRPVTKTARIAGALLSALIAGIGLTDVIAKEADKPVAAKQNVAGAQQASSKTFAISGICTDETGKPLADIRVRLYRSDLVRAGRIEPSQETRTDDGGRYRFTNVEVLSATEEVRVNYLCVLVAPGRATHSVYVHRVDQDQVQSVQMGPAATLTGRVTDPDGRPIGGAWVWTQGVAGEPVDGIMSAKTDADGRYAIHDLDKFDAETAEEIEWKGEDSIELGGPSTFLQMTSIAIRARHPDHVRIEANYTRAPGTVDFVLPTGGSLEGQVIDAVTKKPAENVIVTVRPASSIRRDLDQPSESNFREGKTDAQGNYRFTGLGTTNYTISVRSGDRACAAVQSGTVTANETHRAPDLELNSGCVIEGQVIDDDGRPVARHDKFGHRIMVMLRGPSTSTGGEGSEYFAVDDKGQFRIRVAPGRNHLTMQDGLIGRPIENPEQDVEIATGETRQVIFRVLKQAPPKKRDIPPEDLPTPVPSEQEAANSIRNLGGWYKLDADGHVVEVNMVYYVTQKGRRYDNNQLTDKSLSYLSHFPRLKSLCLSNSQATDDGFRLVGQLPQLEKLLVWNAKLIGDTAVKHLTNLTTLKSIDLWDCRVTDEGINDLAKIASIDELMIGSDLLTDKAFQYAKRLPRLKWLDVRGKLPFTDQAAQHVAQMPMLEKLTLLGNITNKGLREMHRVKTLKSVELGSDKITVDAVLELQKAIPDLKVSALGKQFPSYHALQDAVDPKRQQINREEGSKGLQQIQQFLKLMSEGKTDQAATLCRSFTCEDPDPSSLEAALEPPEYCAGSAVVKHIQRQIATFADCNISQAYGDTELVIAITTASKPEIIFRKGSDGRRQQVKEPVVLRAVKSHGKWYVDSDNIAGSDDPQWRINYFLGDHAGAQKLLQ